MSKTDCKLKANTYSTIKSNDEFVSGGRENVRAPGMVKERTDLFRTELECCT